MKFSLTADQVSAMIADGVRKALAAQGASPQPASPHFLPKGSKAAPSDLAAKDQRIVNAFAKRGFKVTLMNRADPSQPYDVRPFRSWLALGYVVRKGQRGVRGLFHITQCDKLPAKASPKVAPAQRKAKAKGKPQPTLI